MTASEHGQLANVMPTHPAVDFALTEAAYAVVRILDRFPVIALPDGEKVEPLGLEKRKRCSVPAPPGNNRSKYRPEPSG